MRVERITPILERIKLTLQLQLVASPDEAALLLQTIDRFNAAASHAARVGFEAGVFSQIAIHKRCHRTLRDRYGLSAQMAVRAIGKAVEVFARDKSRCPSFRPHGAITYDERILSFKGVERVSLWTLEGRKVLPLVYGEYQKERFGWLKRQVDLAYRGERFYLYATVDLPEGAPVEVSDFLGVDLGIVQLVTDSDGETFRGAQVEKARARHLETRTRLQKRGSRGAKRLLRKISGREKRFRAHANHGIAKRLVEAQDTRRALVLEDLSGIRDRTEKRLRKAQRGRHSGWAFLQLRAYIEYKARLAGVPVLLLDPAYSSRTCSECGHCEKGNRKSQSDFVCLHCGFSLNANLNAARNLRAWAAVNPPQNCHTAQAA